MLERIRRADADLPSLAEAAERALLMPGVRSDAAALMRLLDPEFREIGQSGRVFTRDTTIAALAREASAVGHPVTIVFHQGTPLVGPPEEPSAN